MEVNPDNSASEVRKLRKKLRQIDNLEKISATRQLTGAELIKVQRKDEIRVSLKFLLNQAEEDVHEHHSNNVLTEDVGEAKVEENNDSDSREEMEQEVDSNMLAEDNKREENRADESSVKDSREIESAHEVTDAETMSKEDASAENQSRSQERSNKKKKEQFDDGKDWSKRQFLTIVLEGHHHPICSVDANNDLIISGGYDSAVRVWDAKTGEQRHSMGGHVGCVTTVLLLKWRESEGIRFAASGSLDCSVKVWNIVEGTMIKSLYVFNPVTCVAYGCDILAVGNEGGKVQLLNLDTNETVFSQNCHDDAVTCIKFFSENLVATGAEDGEIKVFDFENNTLQEVFSTENSVLSVTPNKSDVSIDSADSENLALRLRKINCLEVVEEKLIWGDDGYNLKALDWNTGNVTKLRNNLSEFCPTEALTVLSGGSESYMFSSGFDLDNGNSYINVRKVPSLEYVGTISTPSLGHINSIKAFEEDGKVRLVTGGAELKVWYEVTRKLKRRADALEDFIPCKYNCSYNTPRESEEDEDDEEEDQLLDQPQGNNEEEGGEKGEGETTGSRGGWCVIS